VNRLGLSEPDVFGAAIDALAERIARRVAAILAEERETDRPSTIVTYDTEVLSVKQTMLVLGIGKAKLYEFIRSGELVSFLIGNRRMIRREDLDDFLRRLRGQEYTGP